MDAFALLMRRPAAGSDGGSGVGKKRPRAAEPADAAVVDLTRDDGDNAGDREGDAVATVPRPPALLGGAPPKRLVLVRHGETNGYHLRDTDLSPAGRAQASALRAHAALSSVEAVVVSPLTRALQTAVLAFAHGRQLDVRHLPGGRGGGMSAGAADTTTTAVTVASSSTYSAALPLYVTHLARELAGTKGDVGTDWRLHHQGDGTAVSAPGRPVPPELRPLLPVLAGLPPQWWAQHLSGATLTSSSQGPSSSSSSSAASASPAEAVHESRESLRRRVAALRDALRALPHRTVAVVAHAHTLRELGQLPSAMGFCEIRIVSLAM